MFLELGGRELARDQPADCVRGQEPEPQNRTLRHGSAGDEILPASGSILKQCLNNMKKESEHQMHFVYNAIKSHRRKSRKSISSYRNGQYLLGFFIDLT